MPGIWYPITYEIERPERYDRVKVLFRLVLAFPLLLLVGGFSFFSGRLALGRAASNFQGGSGGPLTALLDLLAFVAWVHIIFTGRYPSFRGFAVYLFRWVQNIYAFLGLLTDQYPPFGDGPYPVQIGIAPDELHNRWTVGFRAILAIPHFIVLAFLGIAAFIVTVIAWSSILISGEYPEGMYEFSVGVSRWGARVYGYMMLFVDEYPPFSLEGGPGPTAVQSPGEPTALNY